MSQSFSLVSWLIRIHRSDSCIDHDSRWYALAEDWKGSHCPYPHLPAFAKRLFDWRVGIASHRKRGTNWWFHCDNCGARSFYTLKNEPCRECWFFCLPKDGKPPRWSTLKFAHWLEDFIERLRHWRRYGSDVPF